MVRHTDLIRGRLSPATPPPASPPDPSGAPPPASPADHERAAEAREPVAGPAPVPGPALPTLPLPGARAGWRSRALGLVLGTGLLLVLVSFIAGLLVGRARSIAVRPAIPPPVPMTAHPSPGPPASAGSPVGLPSAKAASAPAASSSPSAPVPAVGGVEISAPFPPYAVELGPLGSAPEAEALQRRLGQAGYRTALVRRETGGSLYAPFVGGLATPGEAEGLATALRDLGLGELVIAPASLGVRIGSALPLRGAVQLAERLRGQGYPVRLAAQPGAPVVFVVRHGNFADVAVAETAREALARLGLPGEVVRIR